MQLLWDTLPANLYPVAALLPSGRVFVFAGNRSTILDHRQGYKAMDPFQLAVAFNGSQSCVEVSTQKEDSVFTWSCLGQSQVGFGAQNRTGGVSRQSFVSWPAVKDGWVAPSKESWIVSTPNMLCLEILGDSDLYAKVCRSQPARFFDLYLHPMMSSRCHHASISTAKYLKNQVNLGPSSMLNQVSVLDEQCFRRSL
jgi:hypothetical protein